MKTCKSTVAFLAMVAMIAFPARWSYAATITLKSGHKVEGRILERSADAVKVDFDGTTLTYYWDEIASVDGVSVAASKTPEPASISAQDVDMSRLVDELFDIENTREDIEGWRANILEYMQVRKFLDGQMVPGVVHPDVDRVLKGSIDRVCAQSEMEQGWKNYYLTHADPVRLQAALGKKQEPVFIKASESEKRSYGRGSGQALQQSFQQAMDSPDGQERIKLFQRFELAIDDSKANATVAGVCWRNLARAMSSIGVFGMGPEQMEAAIPQMVNMYQLQLQGMVMMNYLFKYQDLSNDEIKSLVEYYESPDGKWVASLAQESDQEIASKCSDALRDELIAKRDQIGPTPWMARK